MKIFKMIVIFTLCFLLVGCGGKSKAEQVKEAYFDKGIVYASYKMDELYGEEKDKKEVDEFIEVSKWLLEKESDRQGLNYKDGKIEELNNN